MEEANHLSPFSGGVWDCQCQINGAQQKHAVLVFLLPLYNLVLGSSKWMAHVMDH